MTTPSDQPQYSQPQSYPAPGQPPAPAQTPPPVQAPAPGPGPYPQQAYQQTGPQGYASYAAQPQPQYQAPAQPSSLAGGLWGIILLALGGSLAVIGLIALFVTFIVDVPIKSAVLYNAFLEPGLLLCGLFLGLQFWATVRKEKK
ncbi:MAG: hypothetical protein LBS27_05525 [Bifidobacteriaceae bacterium]|nr:hypothetical protein [Bifidobacteriaceae bacterium]